MLAAQGPLWYGYRNQFLITETDMKRLYLECTCGAAGDMLCAALYELLDDKAAYLEKMNSLGLRGVEVRAESAKSGAIAGTRMHVSVHGEEEHEHRHHHEHEHEHHHEHDHEHHHEHDHGHHHHASLADITGMIASLPLSEGVKTRAQAVYALIAEAEAKAHGTEPGLVHFHEVGTLDAVADVVGFCLLCELLAPDEITASPVTTGRGTVMTAHGLLPVPAPATASLLTGIPTRAGDIDMELCTPTGAALLRYFCASFGGRPDMAVTAVGCGLGSRELPDRPNCVRAFLGETALKTGDDELTELRATVDDMTPEAAAFAAEALLDAGARDAYIAPVVMKKGRPGFVFVCLCDRTDADKYAQLLFRHTTTLGVRRFDCRRTAMEREISERETPYGLLRVKTSSGAGVTRRKAEYEDIAAAAKKLGVSFMEAEKRLRPYIED